MECGCNSTGFGPYLANSCGGSSFLVFMGLVDAIIRSACDVSAVCGRVNPKARPDASYDFIVIGGGTGGSVVAGRLAQHRQWKTLLIEAGVDEPEAYQVPAFIGAYDLNPTVDWMYRTSDEPVACQGTNGSCAWPRAKILGGCSVVSGMMYTRGTPPDYDKRWKGAGIKGWSWKEVLPFFKKAEGNRNFDEYDSNYHGRVGPMIVSDHYYVPDFANAVIQGAREAGFPITKDLNGANYTGFAIPQSFILNGSRVSTAKAYVRPHRNEANLHVMLNSTTTKILFDNSKRAYAVEFIYNNQTYTVRAKKEIILAAGTMNSPQILLQSGVGPKDALDAVNITQIHNLPGVGNNLTNHVTVAMKYDVKALADIQDTVNADTITQYLDHRGGPLASPGIPVTSILASSVTDASDPDIQMFFQLTSNKCSASGEPDIPVDASKPDAVKTWTINPVVLQPKSRGRITLRSNDPLVPPQMVGNYLTVKGDEDILIEGIRLVQRLVNSTTLRDTWGVVYQNTTFGNCSNQYTFDSDDYWRCAVRHSTGPENHQASSLKMGPLNDTWTVLDDELRVIGVKNLRVADASAMPVVTSSNTIAPVVMIAERAADFIARAWIPSIPSQNTKTFIESH